MPASYAMRLESAESGMIRYANAGAMVRQER